MKKEAFFTLFMAGLSDILVRKSDKAHIQFIRYLFAGGVAAGVDMGVFYMVHNAWGYHYLGAQTAGFISGVITNYLISIAWVFRSTGNIKKEFMLFLLVGIGGLLWSYLFLWLFIDGLGMRYFRDMLSKALTVLIVLFWNFLMRKRFVFSG